MEMTPRLGLPLLVAGQVQKEVFHNEALALLDLMVAGSGDAGVLAAPPATPVVGRCYRVAASGTSGAFAGQEGKLAGWTDSGWRFLAPQEGMRLTERSTGTDMAFRDGAWTVGSLRASEVLVNGVKVIGARSAAIADATGGTVTDVQLRAVVGQILGALRQHGLIAT